MPTPTFSMGFTWDNPENHDSGLDKGEMIALASRICEDVPGMKNPPVGMPLAIKKLSEVLRGTTTSDPPIIFEKGIHQDSQLHFTLKVNFAHKGSFHIYVAKGDATTVYSKPKKTDRDSINFNVAGKVMPHTLYLYKSVGISYEDPPNNFVNWPAGFERNSYPGRKRRDSLSQVTRSAIQAIGPTPIETKSGKLVTPPKK
jgi:hypothetical protein